MTRDVTCRLLSLPTELRLRIFEYVLAPTGVLSLARVLSNRFNELPGINITLLSACRQIYAEAVEILYAENEVCICINAHDTRWPTISQDRLPQPILERLQHLCIVLDCTDYFNASYADVDFTPFEALISLKSLRLAMIYRKHSGSQTLGSLHIAQLKDFNVVAQILERIPADVKLRFGTESGSQQDDLVRNLIGVRARGRGGVIQQASPASLHDAAIGVDGLIRGYRSGRTANVFAGRRVHCDKTRRFQ